MSEYEKKVAKFQLACEYCWNLMKNGMSVDEALSEENVAAAIAAAEEKVV